MTSLVEQALNRGPDVRQATALLRLARARLREREGTNWPQSAGRLRHLITAALKSASRHSRRRPVRCWRGRELGGRRLRRPSRVHHRRARRLRT